METSDGIRISKYISQSGLMSRRASESAILEGRVYINDQKAILGQKVYPGDIVKLDSVIVKQSEEKLYIALNKPSKVITSMHDEKGRVCTSDYVKENVYPVGRLDYMSEGLLLLTNDGGFAYAMTHPKHDIEKKYEVSVLGKVDDKKVLKLKEPIIIQGKKTRPIDVEIIGFDGKSSLLIFTLHEGRNREIRNICKENDLKINYLKRISIGGLKLGDLPIGEWRHLTKAELDSLKD